MLLAVGRAGWMRRTWGSKLSLHGSPWYCLAAFLAVAITAQAQYKGDHIPGFIGLQSGSQPPAGFYVGNLTYIYPTDTIKDDTGRDINLPGNLTSTADAILVNVVTNTKLFGGNFGGSIAFPFIKNRIQLNSLDVNSGFAYTDMFGGFTLGWHLKRGDVTAGYNLYIPTGRFSQGATDNTGLGMWGNEVTLGSTVYFDQKKSWNASATFATEFNTDKKGTNIRVGDLGTVEGGFEKTFYKKVSGPIPMITNIGVTGYAQFKITGDSGSDIPVFLQGLKDRAFSLGPEFNIFFPGPKLTLLARYEPEFGVRDRTQGQTIVFSVVWVARSLIKAHP
jgi:hypothetical protein